MSTSSYIAATQMAVNVGTQVVIRNSMALTYYIKDTLGHQT